MPSGTNKRVSANMEDYLEAIVNLKAESNVARVRDIGRALNVKSSTVNSALNSLSKAGLVIHERYGYVDLTQDGKQLARAIKDRHDTLVSFLTGILGVEQATAEKDACKMEHSLSDETFHKLKDFMSDGQPVSEKFSARKLEKNRT